MEYVERGFKALGLKIKFEIVPILLAALLLAIPAVAGTPNCPVQVSIDLDTYNGAVHYENICLTLPAMYSNGLLSIEGVELGDGIFKDGFDG